MNNIKDVTTASFPTDVLSNTLPVMVDFWAPWCGPCKAMAPVLEDYARTHKGIQIVKVNVDENPELAQKFGVRGIPTLKVFKGGEVVATKVGALNKQTLEQWLGAFV